MAEPIRVQRVQTGVRIEKQMLKVLKGLAEYLDLSLGDLLEGIVLHAFEQMTYREIADVLSLMQLPEGLGDELEDEAAEMEKESPTVVTVVLDKQQHEVFEQAMEKAADKIGKARDMKARAVTMMAAF